MLLSIRCREDKSGVAAEALRRAKFKFPGRQKVVSSRNWGFTGIPTDDFLQWKAEGRLEERGLHVHVRNNRGALAEREADHIFEHAPRVAHVPVH